MSARVLLVFLLTSLVPACGGSTRQDGSTGGSAGSAGTGATGGGGLGGGSGGAGSGGTGGGVSCAGYEDQTPPAGVTVRLQNATGKTLFVGGGDLCGPAAVFEIAGIKLFPNDCNTCEKLQQQSGICPDACMLPPTIMIVPGGHYDAAWSGATFEQLAMPKSCYFEPELAQSTCERRVLAKAGAYTVNASASYSVACDDLGPCSCTPGPDGSCEIPYGASPANEDVFGKALLQMPGTSMVVIELS